MAKELLPDALCPAGAAEAQGRTAPAVGPGGADGDPVRAEDGHPLGVLTCRDGVWERDDVLAQAARLVGTKRASGASCTRCFSQSWPRPIASTGTGPRWTPPRCRPGGQETGKNPTDRCKQGTKRHLVVDATASRQVLVSAANVHDSKMMLATVDAIEPIRANRAQAPSPTTQAPCRQGLRLPSPPSGPAQAPHHPPHRPLWCRAQEPPGTLPVGGRTDALLAQPLPAPEDPLRAPG
jgi:hypothetical protein